MSDALLGRLIWYELMTTDMKAAEAFYTPVVGWSVKPFPGEMAYDIWTRADGGMVGGVMTLPDELQKMHVPPHWMMYVGVPKLEDAVSKIEQLGGSAVSDVIEIPEVGRMRVVKDPQGAAFYVMQPASASETPENDPVAGDVSWRELYTSDAPAAVKFYQEMFGWRELDAMDMGPMGKYHLWGRSEKQLGGMMNKMPEMANVPPHWGLYFMVPDVNAGAERVKANGGKILNGPMEVPGGDWIVNCMDPQGAAFSLHHKKQ